MAKGRQYFETDDFGTERIRRSNADRARRKVIKHRERLEMDLKQVQENLIQGRVIGIESAYYTILTSEGETLRAKTVKSTVSENPNSTLVTIGDAVGIEVGEQSGDTVIRKVYERRTKLSRKAAKRRDTFEQVIAANVDRLLIVSSSLAPHFLSNVIDRYIVAGLEGGLDISIVLNKADNLPADPRREFILEALDHYSSLGYACYKTSAETNEGIAELCSSLGENVSVFAGRSGVGKSSVINAILGEKRFEIGDLTKKEQRGAHTTTNSVMIPLPSVSNAFVVDTPGVREFFNHELDDENLKFHYAEFEPYQHDCAMTNCTHTHEPGCAVFAAVEEGIIPDWRHNSYITLYEEAVAERKKRDSGS